MKNNTNPRPRANYYFAFFFLNAIPLYKEINPLTSKSNANACGCENKNKRTQVKHNFYGCDNKNKPKISTIKAMAVTFKKFTTPGN